MTRAPVFLRPASYRRRRRRDVARLLPVMGAFLFMLPVLWSPAYTLKRDTASDGLYVIAAWALLIVLTWAIARSLAAAQDGAEDDPETDAPPATSGSGAAGRPD